MQSKPFKPLWTVIGIASAFSIAATALASSHREAPFITKNPKVDGTDFYMFRSYESGRQDYVTLVANYAPLQDPYGGPNYFSLDPDALYQIHIDNQGDIDEDITFRFKFHNNLKDLALKIGDKTVSVPLINIGPIAAGDSANLNVVETYDVSIVRGNRATGVRKPITDAATGAALFEKPVDNIGHKSIPDYPTYAAAHTYDIKIPGCSNGRMFVGQRKDPFVVNLGEVFDLVNLNPVGPVNGARDLLADANVTAIILEVPIACITTPGHPVIGAWTTASVRQARVINPSPTFDAPTTEGGFWTQVSRLGMPLVNEVVIGIKDKDKFNTSLPVNDAQFLDYVTHPTLPVLLQALFGVTAPAPPRTDLVQAFLTGLPGLNQTPNTGEMLRLNTAIAPKPAGEQSNLGALGGDLAGFPNGRRPGDDVVDIELRVAMGALLPADQAPSGNLPYTDGAFVDASFFDTVFPYLKTPLPGSPSN